MDKILDSLNTSLGSNVLNIVAAVAILVIGLIVSAIVAGVIRKFLSRTGILPKVVTKVKGSQDPNLVSTIEKWVGRAVFWLLMLFVLMAVLQALQLPAVTTPLSGLLNQLLGYLLKIAGAAALLAIAWVVATVAKTLVVTALRRFSIDEQLSRSATPNDSPPGQLEAGSEPEQPIQISETLGTAVYWTIFLLFLLAALSTLGLNGPLAPIQETVTQVFGALPSILKAVFLGIVGWFAAKIIRMVVTNLLSSVGADQIGQRLGFGQASGGKGLSWIGGTFVFVIILITTATMVLEALQIESISRPASSMINRVSDSLPNILSAVGILVLAYIAGKLVSELVTNVLTGLGFNNVFQWLGFSFGAPAESEESPPEPTTPDPGATVLQTPRDPDIAEDETHLPKKTPSEVLGLAAWIGIVALMVLPATQLLQFDSLTDVVEQLLQIAGQVLVGVVIFGIGLYIANLAFSLISSSGGGQAQIVGQAARIAIITLVTAMALQQMGLAPSIVNLAFGLLLGAVAVALAVAFGFGSIDIAGEQVRVWLADFKERD